jgi:hypothetical protein
MESAGSTEPLHYAGRRLGRRTALTFPLPSPPQKNRSPPSHSSPDTLTPGGHIESFQHFTRVRIDASQVAFVTFGSGVPELPVDPSDSRDKAVGFDGAKNRPCARIELMDVSVSPSIFALVDDRDRMYFGRGGEEGDQIAVCSAKPSVPSSAAPTPPSQTSS